MSPTVPVALVTSGAASDLRVSFSTGPRLREVLEGMAPEAPALCLPALTRLSSTHLLAASGTLQQFPSRSLLPNALDALEAPPLRGLP